MSEKMREILFRGKSKRTEEWLFGDYEHFYVGNDLHVYIDDWGKKLEEVVIETVGQFTGLFDKNGKKIFEGDIIEAIASNPVGEDIEATAIVSLDDYELMWDIEHSHEIEVIGNIHDNPELLKEATNV